MQKFQILINSLLLNIKLLNMYYVRFSSWVNEEVILDV